MNEIYEIRSKDFRTYGYAYLVNSGPLAKSDWSYRLGSIHYLIGHHEANYEANAKLGADYCAVFVLFDDYLNVIKVLNKVMFNGDVCRLSSDRKDYDFAKYIANNQKMI